MVAIAEVEGWAGALATRAEGIAARFRRVAARRRARDYLRGLVAPLGRKNGWQLAAAAGDTSPAAVPDFLTRVRWDADAVRNDLLAYVVAHLGDEQAVLVRDAWTAAPSKGFVTQGEHSAGVKRRYSGTAGRIENRQVAVFLGSASRRGRVLIDRDGAWCAGRAASGRRDQRAS